MIDLKTYKDVLKGILMKCDPAMTDDAAEKVLSPSYAAANSGLVSSEDGKVEYRISGAIDPIFGVDMKSVISDLDKASPNSLKLLIDSPGGSVWPAQSLVTDLTARMSDGMDLFVESRGLVASAATMIYLTASKENRTIVDGSTFMVHRPMSLIIRAGNRIQLSSETDRVNSTLEAIGNWYFPLLREELGVEEDLSLIHI